MYMFLIHNLFIQFIQRLYTIFVVFLNMINTKAGIYAQWNITLLAFVGCTFLFFLFLLAFFPLIPHSKLCTDGVLCAQCHFFPASLANVFQLTCHTVGNYQCQHKNMFCLTNVSGILLCIPCSHCDSISFHQTSCSKCTHSGLTC